MKDFSIIVAMDRNHGIGKNGGLPWHLPSDLKHFKRITSAAEEGKRNAVIMGRKTWKSIPDAFRPLSDRLNLVLTRNTAYDLPSECLKASSLDQAFELIDGRDDVDQVFIIGGASIYDQALIFPECHKLYVTMIAEEFECDAFFPLIFQSFKKVSETEEMYEDGCHFSFHEYQRAAV